MASDKVSYIKDVIRLGMRISTSNGVEGNITKIGRKYVFIGGTKVRFEDVILPSLDSVLNTTPTHDDKDIFTSYVDVVVNGIRHRIIKILSEDMCYDNVFFIELAKGNTNLISKIYLSLPEGNYSLSFVGCSTKRDGITYLHRVYVCAVLDENVPTIPKEFPKFSDLLREVGRFALEESGFHPVFKSQYVKKVYVAIRGEDVIRMEDGISDKIIQRAYM